MHLHSFVALAAAALALAAPIAPQGSITPSVGAAQKRLAPAAPLTPPAPINVRLALPGEVFRLEWDDAPSATGYVVYVGFENDVGPTSHFESYVLNAVNETYLSGYVDGQTYWVSLAGTNEFGEGPVSAPVSGVYGPRGVVSGRAVYAATLANGDSFEVELEGALLSFVNQSNPGALPFDVQADGIGRFRLADVPADTYAVAWFQDGEAGVLPVPVDVTSEGVAMESVALPLGVQPPDPAQTLVGTLRLANGHLPQLDLPTHGVHARATVRALLATGGEVSGVPDRQGRWVLRSIPADGFPLTLEATYGELSVQAPVVAPPLELVPIDLAFAETPPVTLRLGAQQGGVEALRLTGGEPVTFTAEVENEDSLTLSPFWTVTVDGVVQTSTEQEPTFTFDFVDETVVKVAYTPSIYSGGWNDFLEFGGTVTIAGLGCWSGSVAVTYPWFPELINPGGPSTVTITHSGFFSPTVVNTTVNGGGYFEAPLDPLGVPPYVVRVDTPNHMRFLWPFEHRLPIEPQLCVIPAHQFVFSQGAGGSEIVVAHPHGATLTLPAGSLLDPFNQPWLGDVVVEMVVMSQDGPHVFPPTPELRVGTSVRNGINVNGGAWFDVRTDTGVPLTPTAAATLRVPTPGWLVQFAAPGYHQNETTGFFERWGYGGQSWNKVVAGLYEISLGTSGLFLIGHDAPLTEILVKADRTLNYPFQVLTPRSIFPVTVQGPFQHDLGKLLMPQWQPDARLRVVDVRQGPGRRFTDVDVFADPVEPHTKNFVIDVQVPVPSLTPTLPVLPTSSVELTLASSIDALNSPPSALPVSGITSATHFLSRGGVNSTADATDYYDRIQAPPTLAAWKTASGLPTTFGAPLPSVPADDYASAYYYNLGDLGFARAQTMRVRSGVDNEPDVAFAVTNYRSLDDARCGSAPIATVCMDYAAKTDKNKSQPSRYTRFYVYGGNGQLLKEADLDGAGLKGIPNLCVVCHGGKPFSAGDATTDLGSSFLPFDVESYTFHHGFGKQPTELARMNSAVLKTQPTAAIADLIHGWHGGVDPVANPALFDQDYVPTTSGLSWAANTQLYSTTFKAACRVCHVSRSASSYTQFDSLADFETPGYGHYSACKSMQMPHAQRTWGGFWGSSASVSLSQSVPSLPAILGTAANKLCRVNQ